MPGEDVAGCTMRRLWRHPVHKRDSQTQRDPIPMGEPGSGDGALKDQPLMAERKVLPGDRRRLDEPGAKEGPATNHEDHRGPPGIRHAI